MSKEMFLKNVFRRQLCFAANFIALVYTKQVIPIFLKALKHFTVKRSHSMSFYVLYRVIM